MKILLLVGLAVGGQIVRDGPSAAARRSGRSAAPRLVVRMGPAAAGRPHPPPPVGRDESIGSRCPGARCPAGPEGG